MKLTVIIPVLNEAVFLPNCLKSVKFADEVLVIDSGSSDKSVELATKTGARVIDHKWQGFSEVHNFGTKQAKNEWLLFVDADERVSRSLRLAIEKVLANPEFVAYQVRRKNFIMGKFLRFGGWYPDRVTRLIKKTALVGWQGELHERPVIEGSVGSLEANLYHLTHRGMAWMWQKSLSYTQISARILYEHHHPPVKVKNFLGAMGREFYYRTVKTSGWKDGFLGWLEIIYQTFNAFLIQVFLWELQQKESMVDQYRKLDEEIGNEL